MTANELRIGNWVNWDGDDHQEIALVASICKEEVGFRCGDFGLIENIEGILLTEDWLYKFGFKNIDKGDNDYITYTDPNHDYYLQIDVRRKDGKYSILDNSFDDLRDFSMIDIMYVHQLQNLYFALTGEELTFKSE
jgi:hypothetical protein